MRVFTFPKTAQNVFFQASRSPKNKEKNNLPKSE